MSSNGVGSSTPERRRAHASRWIIRLLIAFALSVIIVAIVLVFSTSGAVR